MSSALAPVPAPNLELELAKLANDAMQSGADPHDTTAKLHATISYLRKFPKVAAQATNALADDVASPADITRQLWPHASALTHASGSNAPTAEESESLPADVTPRSRFGGGLASFAAGIPGGEALTTAAHAVVQREPWDESLRDVRSAEESSPIKTPLKIAGAITSGKAIPGSGLAKGALYGGAMGFTDPDPEADRSAETVQNAIIGGGIGAVGDAAMAGGGKLLKLVGRQAAKEKETAANVMNALGRSRAGLGVATSSTPGAPAVRLTESSPGLAGNAIPKLQTAPAIDEALNGAGRPTSLLSRARATPQVQSSDAIASEIAHASGAIPTESPINSALHRYSSLDERLAEFLGQLRSKQPHEVGNVWGDAEIAQGLDQPPPNLEDLLRRSLAAKRPAAVP